MAYDGYRTSDAPYDGMGNLSQPEQHQDPRYAQYTTPYPSGNAQFAPDRVNMPQPQMPSTSPTASLSPSETLSEGARFAQSQPHPQPRPGSINDAVNSAFNNADTSAYLSPEVLSQITATVIQQLKASGLGQASAQPQPHTQPQPQVNLPPHPAQQPTWPQASGVIPPPLDPTPAMASRATASTAESNYVPSNAEYTASPTTARFATDATQPSPRPSPAPPMERRASLSSQGSEYAQKGPRPRPPSRDATVTEMTTLEKIWGKLFENGKPTERLGQFLRGIAVHMIECYPTKNSLVVLPGKMQRFYKDTHVKSDPYPWHDIFDDHTSSISRLYREIEAEHHLVQEIFSERPDIPGLTPRGFEKWTTLMILAHPDREYERLQKAVLDMPISNPDDRKERFPKEIPRKLFPDIPDLVLREKLDHYLAQHCGVDLPPITEEERSKIASQAAHRNPERISMSHATTGPESTASSFADRGNNSQSASASASASAIVDDDEETIPARPIERERKPYSAQPGGGKVYDESSSSARPPRDSFSARSRPKMDPPSASSAASAQRPLDHYSQESLYAPSGAGVSGGGMQRTASAHRRSRSSSLSVNARGDYRHSDTDLSGNDHVPRYTGLSSAGDQHYVNTVPTSSSSSATSDLTTEDGRRFRDFDRDRLVRDDERLYDTLRERERERDKKFHDHLQSRGTWPNDEEYYRGLLGGQGGGPVGSGGGGGYDYKSYAYR